MIIYIHRTAWSGALDCDLKSVVADPLMRRRMSRIVRDGVMTAAVCAGEYPVDAILTASAYGCLADSEKFLRTAIESDEQLLSPTPFIQSTFNTVGATIALLRQNHSYNVTYAHGEAGFGTAMLDAAMLLEETKAHYVLVGAAEEITPTVQTLLERLQVRDIPQTGGAVFFLLASEPKGALARISLELQADMPSKQKYNDPLTQPRRLYDLIEGKQNGVVICGGVKMEVECI